MLTLLVLLEVPMKNNLRKIRKEKGLTQKQVAEKLGLKCEDRLSHWERGNAVPSVKNLLKLAEVYQVSVHEIVRPTPDTVGEGEVIYLSTWIYTLNI